MHFGQNHATVAFATNRGPFVAHAHRDVHLANRRSHDGHARRDRHVLDDPAGGKIRYKHSASVPEHHARGQCERKVFADRSSLVRDKRESIDVGIHGESDRGPRLKHESFQLTEILGDRLRRARKPAVGLAH